MSLFHRLHSRCACGSALASSEALAASASRPFTLSGTKRVYERPRPFAIRHIALDLTLEIEKKAVRGVATLDVTRVDAAAGEIALDAVGFEIERVEVATDAPASSKRGPKSGAFRAAEHVYDGEFLRVTMPEGVASGSIRVTYRCTPRRGLYFLAPDEHVTDRPHQVWSQFQDEDARYVFPCHDKPHVKQTTELKVRVPAGWFALSNGELASDDKQQKAGVFHWKMNDPHPSYLVTLAAGEFAKLEGKGAGVPITYYVPKGREVDGERTFRRTPDMVRRFGELTGVPFPWNKYAQIVVSDFIFGGMENTTATTMYEHILLDERAALDITSDDLIAHELAHQWFGDLVTCRDWSHAWLNEGFATFMEHIDREGHLGADEYDYGIHGDLDAYLGEARGRYRRPIVCQDYDAPIDIFDRHLYEKGACVLHLLRRELGDAVFWQGVKLYLTRHARSVVETRDLMRALEEVSGKSLERFFEQWVLRPGHPELSVKIEHDHGLCTVTVKQTQATGKDAAHAGSNEPAVPIFAFDLAFDIAEGSGVRREVRSVDQATHTFAFPAPKRPSFVVVDPDLRVLGSVSIEAPGDMLRAQIAGAPSARGRMLAVAPLSKLDDAPTVKALAKALANDGEFWAVRAEAAGGLGALRSDDAFEALVAHVATAHPKVRRAVAVALGHFHTAKAADALKKLALRDASYLVEAEAARALGATRQTSAFETLLDVIDRPSWADVVRAGAIAGLASLRDERAIPHLTARTRYGVSIRGRRAAIVALPKLSSDRKTREVLEELLESSDPYLRVDIVRALVDIGDVKARPALQRQLDRDLDGRVRRRIREALRDIGGGAKRESEKLRDELEALRGEHAEMRARVSKLEALVTKGEKAPSKAAKLRAPESNKRPNGRSHG